MSITTNETELAQLKAHISHLATRSTPLLGVSATGAILVRPDQHVGWRSFEEHADSENALRAAFNQILART